MSTRIVYDIQNLVKQYPRQPTPANRGLNLQIYEGEIFGLLGDNGAGKTTLVRQMVNLQASTSGTILLFGQMVGRNAQLMPRYVGYMPQDGAALNQLSVAEALYFTAHLRGFSRADARRECELLLEMWELGALRTRYSSQLSDGQKRLLRLAVAAAGRLPVLILDEPTNDLDPQKRKLVWEVLRRLNSEQGTTILFVTHDALEAEKIIQRVGIMRAGEFVALGRMSEMKRAVADKMHMEVLFDLARPPVLPAHLIPHELFPGRWQILLTWDEAVTLMSQLPREHVEDIRLYTATLEDIYLHYATAK